MKAVNTKVAVHGRTAFDGRRRTALRIATLAVCAALGTPALAAPIQVTAPFLQLYNVSPNSDGFRAGPLLRFGATAVTPNGDNGTTGFATTVNRSTNAVATYNIPFDPGPAVPNFYLRTIAYDANLSGPYTLNFQNPSSTPYQTTLSLPAGATETPFVNSVTVTGTVQSPQFAWTPPAGTTVNGYRIGLYDKSLINTDPKAGPLSNGQIVSRNLPPSTTAYTITNADISIAGYTITASHQYSVEISLLQTRDGQSSNLANNNVYALSRVYADYTPFNNGAAAPVNLPVTLADGSFQFDLAVRAGQLYRIDPALAYGYDYRIGAGDPNFASVLFPTIQGAPFYVSFLNHGVLETDAVSGGSTFAFPTGGVGEFNVTGIGPGLDRSNTTAFVTGLTFTGSGFFTGTQTSLLPEPVEGALLVVGGAAWIGARRRRPVHAT